MSEKSDVIETDEALEKILNILDDKEKSIYLTDGTEENKILLDYGAIVLLRNNFIIKKEWGVDLIGNG
ncbi:hypothetical protein [Clostridium celatum]|uniref:hypothetical protein n=1 Tax=Clostridium celatum TaxID=36834 RepID=UPI00189BDA6D|nr:hypothetical protein [Clostridium celatum]